MEIIDKECCGFSLNQQPVYIKSKKMIFFLKCLPVVCVLELIAIVALVGFICINPSTHEETNTGFPNEPQVFSYGSSKFHVGLIDGCSQRIHDFKHGVRCESKNIESCPPIDSNGRTTSSEPSPSLETTIITTSESGLRLDTRQVSLKQIQCSSNQHESDPCRFKTQLNVYMNEREQEIIGWGGAMTDSAINNILSMTINGTRRLLDDYFSQNGLNFNMIRVTIGGSDFSARFYTNDDINTTESSDDFDMKKFGLKEEDLLYKIPMLNYIQEEYFLDRKEDLKLIGSMWSPPTWMKDNGHYNKGYLKGEIDSNLEIKSNREQHFKALADLKKNFLLAYYKNSIKFWGITVMNEPFFAIQPYLEFNTMIFPAVDYGRYIAKYLGPSLKENIYLKNIKLLAHDDNRRYLKVYTENILDMKGVKRYIDGISLHGYVDNDYEMIDEITQKYKTTDPNFFAISTELCSGHLPMQEKALIGNWHRGVHYALDIIRSLQHSVSGWIDWNMALDMYGGPGWLGNNLDSSVIVDRTNDAYYKSPMFYVIGQFSKYIPPHSFKLKTTIVNDAYDSHFETVTFHLPGDKQLATVVLNNNPYEVELNIKLIDNLNTSNVVQQVTCQPNSIITIIYPRKFAPLS